MSPPSKLYRAGMYTIVSSDPPRAPPVSRASLTTTRKSNSTLPTPSRSLTRKDTDTHTHLCRSGAGEPLPYGHELDELFFGEPLGLVHEALVEQSDVGGGAAVRHDAQGKELPKYLYARGGVKIK